MSAPSLACARFFLTHQGVAVHTSTLKFESRCARSPRARVRSVSSSDTAHTAPAYTNVSGEAKPGEVRGSWARRARASLLSHLVSARSDGIGGNSGATVTERRADRVGVAELSIRSPSPPESAHNSAASAFCLPVPQTHPTRNGRHDACLRQCTRCPRARVLCGCSARPRAPESAHRCIRDVAHSEAGQ